jgi:serine/threonine-protein kinase HipA
MLATEQRIPRGNQNELLAALRRRATDPATETLEFIQRDVLNLAMRNTDNHARNTAAQRTPDGVVRLTPVFDFAPMFLDSGLVPRSVHWRTPNGDRMTNWQGVLDELANSCILSPTEREVLAQDLRGFSATVARLPELAIECGVEMRVLQQCLAAIDAQVRQLATLR